MPISLWYDRQCQNLKEGLPMRKHIAMIFAIGVILAGVAVTSVSAKEHNVEKGDNLWNIAKEYNTSVDALVDINDLATTVIQPGQIISIYYVHEVEKGESLSTIADEYEVDIEDIREWNHLRSDLLYVGQELTIEELPENESGDIEVAEVAATPKEEKQETKEKKQSEPAQKEASTPASTPEGKTLTVTATAYTADCEGCSGVTYTGIDLNKDRSAKVIAVDPNVIPLGSKVYVEGYGEAIAGDIGGAIKGNKIDLHVPTKEEAYSWGVREVEITILNE